jgi:hypothetical protein
MDLISTGYNPVVELRKFYNKIWGRINFCNLMPQ